MTTTTYTATATRESRWWVLDVDGIGATQVRALRNAAAQVRDMIAVVLDVDPATIAVDVRPELEPALAQSITDARDAVLDLEKRQREVAIKSRAAAAALQRAGLTGADVASVLGVSPQRASQLLATKGHGKVPTSTLARGTTKHATRASKVRKVSAP